MGDIEIERIHIIDIQPGDTVVLKIERPLSPESRKHLIRAMKLKFPDHKTLVLDGGLELEVYREKDGQ